MDDTQIKDIQESLARIHRNLAYFRHDRKFGRRIRKLEDWVFKLGVVGGAAVLAIAIVSGVTWIRVPRVAASTAEEKAQAIATKVVNEKLPSKIVQEIESYRERAKAAAEAAEGTRDEIAATLSRFRETVPLGMILPFFGKKIPDGFVLANGEETWPDEDWVPDHLRPKNGVPVHVPDLRGQMLGGSVSESDTGLAWTQGQLRIEGATMESTTIASYENMIQWTPGNTVTLPDLLTVGPQAQVKTITVSDTSVKYAGETGGSQVISLSGRDTLPRHIMCQFIIRMR